MKNQKCQKCKNKVHTKKLCKHCYMMAYHKKNKNKTKLYNKQYKQIHKSEIKKYEQKNDKKIKNFHKKYRKTHKKEATKFSKIYYIENKTEKADYQRYYIKTPKGKFLRRLNKIKRKNRKIKHAFTQKQWDNKEKLTKGFCPVCYKYVGIKKLTMDHNPALSKVKKGYKYTINKVIPICRPCNSKKHTTNIKIDFKSFLNNIKSW